MNVRQLAFSVFKIAVQLLRRRRVVSFPLTKYVYKSLYRVLRPHGITLTEIQGSKMYLDPEDEVCSYLLVNGVWEKCETALFKQLVKKGMVVVDIEAHTGYHTLLAAVCVGEDGKVFAFEPDPNNYSLLVKNIEINGYRNVIPVQKAVSNKTGTTQLILNPGVKAGNWICDVHQGREHITITATTLDEFFKNKDYQIDVIKMDIEGAEMAALQGMANIIKENKGLKLITEVSVKALQRAGAHPEDYVNKLVEYHFELYYINEHSKTISAVDTASIRRLLTTERAINLLCSTEIVQCRDLNEAKD